MSRSATQPNPTPTHPLLSQQISASLLRMSERNAFFATLALYARYEVTTRVPTAATDGRTVYVNPDFWGKLTVPEQDGLLLHEILHAALQHVTRRGGRDPKLWNIAADIVINGMILKEGYTLPQGGMRNERLEHLGSEEVFEMLAREAQKKEMAAAPWDDLLEGAPAEGRAGGKETSGEGQGAESKTPGQLGGEANEASQAQDHTGHWRDALEQAALVAKSSALAGKIPAALARELPSLRGAQLDWRSYLWRYLTQTPTDFNDFDRRFVGRGLYLDALAGESVQVLLAVDTSGSIKQDEIAVLLSEVQEILRAYPHLRCELYYADAKLYGPHLLKAGSPLPPPVGGGGTDFRPFFERIAAHPFQWGRTVAIYLTDGYGTFPTRPPRCPVLWVVTPGGRALDKFPFGEGVRLLKSQYTPFVAISA